MGGCRQGTTAPAKKTGWGSQSKAMRSSLRGKASKGGKGSKSGKGGMKRNASFGLLPGDGTADGISGRRRSMNVCLCHPHMSIRALDPNPNNKPTPVFRSGSKPFPLPCAEQPGVGSSMRKRFEGVGM